MFFTTEEGTNVIQLGTGDTEIMGSHLHGHPDIGSVSLIRAIVPADPNSDIDRKAEKTAGWVDEDLGVHTRFVFTDTRSIDALINQLEKAKSIMIDHQQVKKNQDHTA